MRIILCFLVLSLGLVVEAKSLERGSILSEYNSGDPAFADADAVMNKVRMATVNTRTALQYAVELEQVLEATPHYPYAAQGYYFLGLNYKIAAEYGKAIDACSRAIELKPGLKFSTPVESFIKGARFEWRALWIPRFIIMSIAAVMIAAVLVWRRCGIVCHSNRLFLIRSIVLLAVWCALIIGLTQIDTASSVTQVDDYPQPVLVNTTMGSIGSAPLAALAGYGTAALCAVLLFCFLTSGLQNYTRRKLLNCFASMVLSTGAMGLCYMDFCYRNAEIIWQGKLISSRMNILVKDLVWRDEIPDDMLHLYDEDFRKKVIAGRKVK